MSNASFAYEMLGITSVDGGSEIIPPRSAPVHN